MMPREGCLRRILWRFVSKRTHARWALRYGRCHEGCGLCFDAIAYGRFGVQPGDVRVMEMIPEMEMGSESKGGSMFRLWKSDKNQQYYFSLELGDVRLASEGYTEKASATNGIDSVKENAPKDERYERKHDEGGYWFNLKAGNGEIIATATKKRATEAERDADIAKIKSGAAGAMVKEA